MKFGSFARILAYMSGILWLLTIIIAVILLVTDTLPVSIIINAGDCGYATDGSLKHCIDVVSVASQLGRFDAATAVLAIIGLIVAFFSLVGFSYVRDKSLFIARETAEKVADRVARKTASAFIDTFQDRMREESSPAPMVEDVDIGNIERERREE